MEKIKHLKRHYFLLFITILLFTNAFSQIYDDNMEIRSFVPTDEINICLDEPEFKIEIENVNLNDVITNSYNVTVTMPDGMVFIPGTLVAVFNEGDADETDVTATIVNERPLTFNITHDLAYRDVISIYYNGKANCELIPPRQEGQEIELITVFNNINLVYTYDSNNQNLELESNSYNLRYADIRVPITADEQSIDGYRYQEIVRDIPVFNGASAGSINELEVLIEHDRVNLEYLDAEILAVDLNRQPISSAVAITATDDDTNYVFTVSSSVLNSINLGTTFDGNEGFIIRERIRITGTENTIETTYKAQWGCEGNICNADPVSSANATSIVYIENLFGQPEIAISYQHIQKPNYCSGNGIVRYVIKNNSEAPEGTAINLRTYFYAAGVNGLNIIRIFLDLNHDGTFEFDFPFSKSSNGYYYYFYLDGANNPDFDGFTSDPDGEGVGLADVDLDGYFDDLPPLAELSVEVEYSTVICSDGNISSTLKLYAPHRDNRNEYINVACGLYNQELWSFNRNVEGPTDIVQTQHQRFYFLPYYYYFYQLLDETNVSFTVELIVPDGFVLADEPDARYANDNGPVLTATQEGNIIQLTGANYGNYSLCGVNLDLTCEGNVQDGESIITWKLIRTSSYTDENNQVCECERVILEKPFTTYAHFDCSSVDKCIDLKNENGFLIRRTTLGWDPDKVQGFWHKEDLTDENKVTIDDPDINLSAAMVYDSIEARFVGVINENCSPDTLHAEIKYISPVTENLLEFVNITFTLNGNSYGFDNSQTENYTIKNTDSEWTLDFFVAKSDFGESFPSGPVSISCNFKINNPSNITSFNPTILFRGKFSAYKNDTSQIIGSESFGDNLKVMKILMHLPGTSFNSSTQQFQIRLAATSNGFSDTKNTFLNEIRPLIHLERAEVQITGDELPFLSASVTHGDNNEVFTDFSIVNGRYIINTKKLPLYTNDTKIKSENYYLSFNMETKPACSSSDIYFSTSDVPIEYNIYAYSYLNAYCDPCTGPVGPIYINNPRSYSIGIPYLALSTETNQPGFEREVTWITRVSNSRIWAYPRGNLWIAFEPASDNTANIIFNNVTDEIGNEFYFQSYGINNENIMVELGPIKGSETKEIHLTASYENCEEGTIDKLNVFTGWDLYAHYPTVADYPCTPITGELTLTHKTANLQWEVNETSAGPYNHCDDVTYEVKLFSTGLANMYDLQFGLNLPDTSHLTGPIQYTYGSNTGVISDISQDSWNLVNYIPELINGFPGNSEIALNLTVNTECGYDAGDFVHFSIISNTNCGDVIAYDHQMRIPITGFTNLDNLRVNVFPAAFSERHSETNIRIQVSNLSSDVSATGGYIEVILAPEFSYVSGSTSPELSEPVIIVDANGNTILTWDMPDIDPSGDLTFNFDIADQSICPDVQGKITASSYVINSVSSSCPNQDQTCATRGTKHKSVRFVSIPVIYPDKADSPQGQAQLCKDPGLISYSTAGAQHSNSYEWLLTPSEAGTLIDNGMQADVIWSSDFTGTALIKVRGINDCGEGEYSDDLIIQIYDYPGIPVFTLSDTSVCQNSTYTYSVAPAPNVSSYEWEIPTGAAIVSGGTSNSVQIQFMIPLENEAIRVRGYNEYCGYGPYSEDILVTVNPLPDAGFMGLPDTMCSNNDRVLLIPTNPDAVFSGPGVELISGDYYFNPQLSGQQETITVNCYVIDTVTGCTNQTSQDVIVKNINIIFNDIEDIYCKDAPVIDLTNLATPAGGTFSLTGPNGYYVSGISGIIPGDLEKGEYELEYVVQTEDDECTYSRSINFTIAEVPQVIFEPDPALPVCKGTRITLTSEITYPSGDQNNPYQYNWSNGAGNISEIEIIPPQTADYSLTVTDANGCVDSYSSEIEIWPLPVTTIVSKQDVSCHDAEDGELTLRVSGSTAPYSYLIIPYSSAYTAGNTITGLSENEDSTFTGLKLAMHTIKATDANNCESNQYGYIGFGGPKISLCSRSIMIPTEQSVIFDVNVTRTNPDGTGKQYRYNITNSSGTVLYTGTGTFNVPHSTPSVIVDIGASYYLELLEALDNSCIVEKVGTPIQAAKYYMNLDNPGGVYKKCVPDDIMKVEISANITVTNCTDVDDSQFTFRIIHELPGGDETISTISGDNTAEFETGIAGNYRVELDYGSYTNCAEPVEFIISESAVLEVEIVTHDATCYGENNGWAEAIVTGYEGEVYYEWYSDIGGVQNVISNESKATELSADITYGLNVTDSRDCGYTANSGDQFTIEQPDLLVIDSIIYDENNFCAPVTAYISGGTASYNFEWKRYELFKPQVFNENITIWDNINNTLIVGAYVLADEYDTIYSTEYTENTVNLFSETTENELMAGQYLVKVEDKNGCKAETEFELPMSTDPRTYNLCIRWETKGYQKNDKAGQVDKSTIRQFPDATDNKNETADKCIERLKMQQCADVEELCYSGKYLNDELTVNFDFTGYNYTLYYYDRAGNLVRTVPPKGVDQSYEGGRESAPNHTFVTKYAYNNLGQLIWQETPDAGKTNFIYNEKGQLRFSQNAQQIIENKFSYTKYDELARIREVGECSLNSLTYNYEVAGEPGTININNFNDLQSVAELDVHDFSTATGLTYDNRFPAQDQFDAGNIAQQTITHYSVPELGVTCNGSSQRYLLNRISYTKTYNKDNTRIVTYYSYDPHGNVEWIVNEIPGLGKSNIAYEYDLLSGNVNMVLANKNRKDAFYHKYEYDEDNRLKVAFTSSNGEIWDMDAKYIYYKHGPLKRIELGQDEVQGIDYTYTLQGWLKAINTPTLAGIDGEDDTFAGDKFGMMLGYFEGDFNRAGTPFESDISNNSLHLGAEPGFDLYNGNISNWSSVREKDDGSPDLTGYQYNYDKLNRIKQGKYFIHDGTAFNPVDDYGIDYKYDYNGNITELNRYGASDVSLNMDNFSYKYYPGKNRLSHVDDLPENTDLYDEDVDDQASGNYTYDSIGNLIRDEQEGISIEWNVYGKVAEIIPDEKSDPAEQKPHIVYNYDAAGNRIMKLANGTPEYSGSDITGNIIDPEDVTITYYHRDASGNIMAIYQRTNRFVDGHYEAVYRLLEVPVYGSDRLGMYTPDLAETLAVIPFNTVEEFNDVSLDLDKILPYIPGAKNFIVSSQGTDYTEDEPPQPINVGVLNLATFNKYDNKYGVSEGVVDAIANINGSLALAEDGNGNMQFYVATAQDYLGSENELLVYNKLGDLMYNSGGIAFDYTKQCQVAKALGGPENEYFIFTIGTNGKLYYHRINMDEAGGTGNVTEINQALDADGNTNFSGHLFVIEDNVNNNIKVITTLFNSGDPGSIEVVRFEFDQSISAAVTGEVILTVDNSYGMVDIQISPDGSKMAVYHFNGDNTGFDIYPAEVLVYNMDDNYRVYYPGYGPVNTVILPYPTTAGNNVSFNGNATQLIIGVTNLAEQKILAYSQPTGITTILDNISGNVHLENDNRLYVSPAGNSNLIAINDNLSSNFNINLTGSYPLTGNMAKPVYRVSDDAGDFEAYYHRNVGLKRYELKDHLGNVRVLVSDALTAEGSDVSSITNDAEVLAQSDYYPFGMLLPGRNYNADRYRFGFNGKEMDNEVSGTGNQYDYGFRIYNPRIGKFLSVDPLTMEYPWYTPYQFASNSPIWAIDLDGLEAKVVVAGLGWDEEHTELIIKRAENAVNQASAFEIHKEAWTGEELLDILIEQTHEHGSIGNLLYLGHSTGNQLLMTDDECFYKKEYNFVKNSREFLGPIYGGRTVEDIVSLMNDGEIVFEEITCVIFGGCNTYNSKNYENQLNLLESFVTKTGVTAIGASGEVSPIIKDGKDSNVLGTNASFFKLELGEDGSLIRTNLGNRLDLEQIRPVNKPLEMLEPIPAKGVVLNQNN